MRTCPRLVRREYEYAASSLHLCDRRLWLPYLRHPLASQKHLGLLCQENGDGSDLLRSAFTCLLTVRDVFLKHLKAPLANHLRERLTTIRELSATVSSKDSKATFRLTPAL